MIKIKKLFLVVLQVEQTQILDESNSHLLKDKTIVWSFWRSVQFLCIYFVDGQKVDAFAHFLKLQNTLKIQTILPKQVQSMFNKEEVIEVLNSYHVDREDQTDHLFRIIQNNDKEKFADLAIVLPKKINQIWTNLQEAKSKKPENWIFTRFPVVDQPCKDEVVNAIIMGPCGNGKTETINSICGTDYIAAQTRLSLTREITRNLSLIESKPPFYLIDTPGTTSTVDKLKHAVFLKTALTWKPLNAVFIMVKFENRYQDFFMNLIHGAEIVKDYEEKVVFLVTHLDVSKDPQSVIANSNEMLEERHSRAQVVYFSNIKCDKRELRETLYKIAKSIPQSQMTISERHFHMTFNLTRSEKQALLFNKEEGRILKEMKEIKKTYTDFVDELPNNGEKAEIIQDLSVYLKKELVTLFEDYEKKNKNSFVGLQYYSSYYTLNTAISDLCQQFQKETRSWRKIQFFSTDTTTDIRDLIKQCPNCLEIWYRVQACPSATCGSRPSSLWDFLKNSFFRYDIQRIDRKIILKGKRQMNNDKKQTLQNLHKSKNEEVKKKKYLGCGSPMNFATLPRLENIEEIINELFQTSNKEEVVHKITKHNKTALSLREQVEREVQESVRACESQRNL